ncbi:nucleoside triphosphate pyrophosphohydrolase [bacterium]|nr:nucleoside triphosphate pyrophosphohydrolase [bacterium]
MRMKKGEKFKRLVEIMDILRSDEGCPWDKAQDEKSITNYFLEEVYEAVEALEKEEVSSVAEELGDVLMEIVFLARIFEEKGEFNIGEVLEGINQKMVRRHPHVFGSKQVKDAGEVSSEWEKQKREEKERGSLLEGISKSSPALFTAFKMGALVSSYGFDWKQVSEVLNKAQEEMDEMEKAIPTQNREQISQEIGDMLFSLVQLSRHLNINPELALRQTNQKFIRRFQYIEKKLKEKGKSLAESNLEEMDRIWEESKNKIS